jgi:prevent-host-death family protein
MNSIGAYEAKTHLASLLERVSKGETILITKHGEPIAILKPAHRKPKKPVSDVIDEMKEFRSKHSLKGLSVKKMIETGRR